MLPRNLYKITRGSVFNSDIWIKAMSTSEACNTIPAVVVDGFTENGSWIELEGLKTCECPHDPNPWSNANKNPDITGSQTSTQAIIDIYDIFGPAPQTLQGADLIAAALGALVIVPGFFRGKPAQNEWFHNPSEANDKTKAEFQKVSRNFPEHAKTLIRLVNEAKTKWTQVTSWGAFGLCWGGKVSDDFRNDVQLFTHNK